MEYVPDVWKIMKFTSTEHGVVYKVLAGWIGGYTGSDAWKMNSGITEIKDVGEFYEFHGASGSVYFCYKNRERFSSLTSMIHDKIIRGLHGSTSSAEAVGVNDIVL